MVIAIVLGIMGMHGIGAHGVNLHGPVASAADAAAPAAPAMAGHNITGGAAATVSDVHSDGEAAWVPSGLADGKSDGMGGMVMVCVAMLAGAAVALLAVLVQRARLPRVWAILAPAGRVRVAVPAVLRVGAGPPSVWRFSVIRC